MSDLRTIEAKGVEMVSLMSDDTSIDYAFITIRLPSESARQLSPLLFTMADLVLSECPSTTQLDLPLGDEQEGGEF